MSVINEAELRKQIERIVNHAIVRSSNGDAPLEIDIEATDSLLDLYRESNLGAVITEMEKTLKLMESVDPLTVSEMRGRISYKKSELSNTHKTGENHE